MAQHELSDIDAFAALVQASLTQGRGLNDVVEEVIAARSFRLP